MALIVAECSVSESAGSQPQHTDLDTVDPVASQSSAVLGLFPTSLGIDTSGIHQSLEYTVNSVPATPLLSPSPRGGRVQPGTGSAARCCCRAEASVSSTGSELQGLPFIFPTLLWYVQ